MARVAIFCWEGWTGMGRILFFRRPTIGEGSTVYLTHMAVNRPQPQPKPMSLRLNVSFFSISSLDRLDHPRDAIYGILDAIHCHCHFREGCR